MIKNSKVEGKMKRPMYLKERNLNPPLKSKTRERFEKREGSDKAPTLLG